MSSGIHEPGPGVIPGGAAFGDRFVAVLGAPGEPGWVGADELFGPALPGVLAAVGAARGTDATAVTGTLLFEQYCLRLLAPVLAAALGTGGGLGAGAVLDARRELVRAQIVDGVLRRLAFARPPAVTGEPPDPVAVVAALAAGHLEPLAAAVHRHTRVGLRILRGSMANAAVSTLLHLSWPDGDRARHVPTAEALLRDVPGWAGLVSVAALERGGEPWMYSDRNTCCLAFRTMVNQGREQHFCGTCPVVPRATVEAQFTEATAAYAERHPR